MRFFKLLSVLFALLLSCAAAAQTLEKRSTQVSLTSYTFTNNVLAGSISVENIAYTKVVTVYWAIGDSWSDSQTITAAYSSGPDSTGYEVWTFSGTASGATQFYIEYDVSGSSYYDPGSYVNYQIITSTTSAQTTTTSAPTTTTTSKCTVTYTTTIRTSS